MASLICKERKGMNLSCTSPASIAVCTSIDRRSIVQPSSSRYLDRYTPHLRDPLRSKAAPSATKTILPPPPPPSATTLKQKTVKHKQKSANIARRSLDVLMVSAEKVSPPASSRYLLNSERFSDFCGESESASTPEPPPLLLMGPPTLNAEILEESAKIVVSSDSNSPTTVDKPKDQVVELRVSLHCKGCQAKVKKHLSKMEGVTSFNIDFVTKKVTVIGDVTPLGVLNSISKVKNAQFWPSPTSLSSQKLASYDYRF